MQPKEKKDPQEKIFAALVDNIINSMDKISDTWQQPWMPSFDHLPKNGVTGHRYSGLNLLMLLFEAKMKKWEHPIYATFDQWLSLSFKDGKVHRLKHEENQFIKRDEKGNALPKVFVNQRGGIPICTMLAVKYYNIRSADHHDPISQKEYNELSEEEKVDWVPNRIFGSAIVFNIDQTNIKEARPDLYKEIVSGATKLRTDGARYEPLDETIENDLWLCPIRNELDTSGSGAFYRVSQDSIVLPLPEQFHSMEQYASTAFHEMSHSTGTKERLKRGIDEKTKFGSEKYAKEELVAELSAAMTCATLGLAYSQNQDKKDEDSPSYKDSVIYLREWLKGIQGKPDDIRKFVQEAMKASKLVSEHMLAVERAIERGDDLSEHDYNSLANDEEIPTRGRRRS